MAYNPTIWINDDGTGTVGTPATADNFNNMEQGINNNELAISEHTKQINVLNTITKETLELLNGFEIKETQQVVKCVNNMVKCNILVNNKSKIAPGTNIAIINNVNLRPTGLEPCQITSKTDPQIVKYGWVAPDGRIYPSDCYLDANITYNISFSYIRG